MSNNVTLLELRIFTSVATTGSFSGAALRHRVPPSSVSRHVAALEQKVGKRLFYRHTRAVRLTEAGAAYLADLRPALDLLDAATEQVSGHGSAPQGLLRVNAPVAFGRLHVSPFVLAFQSRHPLVEVELVLTDARVDPVAEGADIVLRIGPMQDSSLTGRALWPQTYQLCASQDYLKRRGTPETVSDLHDHDCLVYAGASGPEVWHLTDPFGKTAHVAPLSRFRSNHAETLLDAAISGSGIVLFPNWLVTKGIESGSLVPILKGHTARTRTDDISIHAIIPENRQRSSKVAMFLDGLVQHVGRTPFWDQRG